jgi:sporulation protein YlmC with PRC-barrel domain
MAVETTATNLQNTVDLVGMQIVGQQGRIIGVVKAVMVDVTTGQMSSLQADLHPDVASELKLEQPWFGYRSVLLPVNQIAGASDVVVLNTPLETMEFSVTDSAGST